jgi:membrane-associated protease RseP (regulator of RpoE activity)
VGKEQKMVSLSFDDKENCEEDTLKNKKFSDYNNKPTIEQTRDHHGKNIKIAILLASLPGIFGFLGLGHFYCRKFRLGFVYLFIGIITVFLMFLLLGIISNNTILLLVIFIGYLILWVWQIYDVKSYAIKYNLENAVINKNNFLNNKNNENKIRIEVEFPKITYHNVGLSLIERIARNRLTNFYATISMYSMPAITGIAIFLTIGSIIVLFQNDSIREDIRSSNEPVLSYSPTLDVTNPVDPGSPISIGALALISSIFVSQFGRAIIAKMYSIKIESMGFTTLIGIIPTNPFLELNKEEVSKLPLKRKSALLAVDPSSNIILSLISFGFLFLLVSSLTPISNLSTDKAGITVLTVKENSLANSIGLSQNSIITAIDNEPIEDVEELKKILRDKIGSKIWIEWQSEDKSERMERVELPSSIPKNKGVLGVTLTDAFFDPELVLDNYKNLFLTHPIAILMPPPLQPNLVPYSDTMSFYYTSNLFGSAYPIIANFLFWIWFVNFNVGIFEALPINHLPGGKLYNSFIEDKLKNKPRWVVKGITISISIISILIVAIAFYLSYS